MRVCVIGTSNSLVRGGWFDGFSSAIEGEVDRFALGGAPFVQFFLKLSSIDLRSYDVIIVDSSPNDETYASHVGYDILFDQMYYMFLATLRRHADTIVLRIPTHKLLEHPSPIGLRQKKIAMELGCSYIDLASVFERIASNGRSTKSLYRDNYHPLTEIMHSIGCSIGKTLARKEFMLGSQAHADYSGLFRAVSIEKANFSVTSIRSSVVNEDFTFLDVGKSFNFGETFYCLGFYVDSGNCNGVVRLHGPDGVRDIYCFFKKETNGNIMRFVPIKNGFIVKGISIVWPHKSSEYALHSDFGSYLPYGVSFGKFLVYSPDSRPDFQESERRFDMEDICFD